MFPGEKADKEVMEAQGVSVTYFRLSSVKNLQGNIINQLEEYLEDRLTEGESDQNLHDKYVIN